MTLRKRTPSRIWEVDFFRGISILLVIVDHAMYDFARVFTFWQNGPAFLAFLNELGKLYLSGEVRYFWRPAFRVLFYQRTLHRFFPKQRSQRSAPCNSGGGYIGSDVLCRYTFGNFGLRDVRGVALPCYDNSYLRSFRFFGAFGVCYSRKDSEKTRFREREKVDEGSPLSCSRSNFCHNT